MNDDDLDLRIYAHRGSRPRMLVRPARQQPPLASPGPTPPTSPLPVGGGLPAAEPVAAPDGAEGPPRRLTMELPVAAPAPVAERVLRILRAPPEWGEMVETAFTRKERELAALFEALEPAAASELFRRLSTPRPDDAVGAGFARLVPERRGRLLSILVAAPRRAAMARARLQQAQAGRGDSMSEANTSVQPSASRSDRHGAPGPGTGAP